MQGAARVADGWVGLVETRQYQSVNKLLFGLSTLSGLYLTIGEAFEDRGKLLCDA